MSRATTAASDAQAAAALTEAISLWRGDPLVNTDSLTLAMVALFRRTSLTRPGERGEGTGIGLDFARRIGP